MDVVNFKIKSPYKFIVLHQNDWYIIINGDAGRSIKLTLSEFKIFEDIYTIYNQSGITDFTAEVNAKPSF